MSVVGGGGGAGGEVGEECKEAWAAVFRVRERICFKEL